MLRTYNFFFNFAHTKPIQYNMNAANDNTHANTYVMREKKTKKNNKEQNIYSTDITVDRYFVCFCFTGEVKPQ